MVELVSKNGINRNYAGITLYNVCAVPWGCSVPWEDILSTVGGVQYRGGYHDKCGDILSTVRVFSTVGGYLEYRGDVQYCGGYHDARGGIS